MNKNYRKPFFRVHLSGPYYPYVVVHIIQHVGNRDYLIAKKKVFLTSKLAVVQV